MKKKIVLMLVGAALCLMVATPALAHGHGGGGHHSSYSGSYSGGQSYSAPTRYTCNYKNCQRTYNHSHRGVSYYGHHAEDGHNHNW